MVLSYVLGESSTNLHFDVTPTTFPSRDTLCSNLPLYLLCSLVYFLHLLVSLLFTAMIFRPPDA